MEHLYTPWRSAYVSREAPSSAMRKTKKSCIFCEYQKSKHDERNLVLFRKPNSYVLMNLYPYNDGHLLIAPHRHVRDPKLLSKEEWQDLNESVRRAISVLENTLHPQGFNIGMNLGKVSGAGLADHLHTHVVPRWLGDTNFLPIIGNTKTINQDLKTLYKKLRVAFSARGSS